MGLNEAGDQSIPLSRQPRMALSHARCVKEPSRTRTHWLITFARTLANDLISARSAESLSLPMVH